MRNRSFTPLFLSLLALVQFACASAPETAPAEVELLTYDAELVEQGLSRFVFDLGWELNNPAAVPARVGAVKWEITFEKEPAKQGEVVIDVEIAPKGSHEGVLKVEVPLATTAEVFAERAKNPAMRWWITASFDIAIAGKSEVYEAQWHGELFAPQQPEITVEAQAGRYGSSTVELSFIIGIKNPNPFSIKLEGLDYAVVVAETEIDKGVLAKGRRLPEAATLQFDLDMTLGSEEKLELAKQLIKAGTFKYSVKAKLNTDTIALERELAGDLAFSRE